MIRARLVVPLAYVLIAFGACMDRPDAGTGPPDPEPEEPQPTLSIIASEPITAAALRGAIHTHSGAVEVSYVSLPSGTLPAVRSVRIRNVTAGGPPSDAIDVFAGGFDPVPVVASGHDELELAFTDSSNVVTFAKTTVPVRRPPLIVRTSPPRGRTDVALRAAPSIIFSEPIDPQTVAGAVRLTSGGTEVDARVELVAGAPWVVEIVPTTSLQPLTTYQLVVTTGVRDLEGDSIATTETITFTTGPALQLTGRIAFVSDREGSTNIYLANGDGSGVTRLTSGDKPAWSPDGSRIVFERGRGTSGGPYPQGAEIRLINVDGSGERLLIAGMNPAWSPDGNRIAYVDSAGISVINVDGSGSTLLIRHDVNLGPGPGHYTGAPAWSPDGTRIAFEYGVEDIPQRVYVMNADGSQPGILTSNSAGRDYAECTPSWSPDGSQIALWHFSLGIATFDASGAGGQQSIASPPFPGVSCFSAPEWSTDGSAVTFGFYQTDAKRENWRGRIYVVDIRSGNSHLLIPEVAAPANPTYADRDAVWSRVLR